MRKAKQRAFRRAPFLVSYWERGRLIFENYATGARASAAPITSEVLHFFDRWRTAKELFTRLNQYAPGSLEKAIRHLVEHSFLQRSDKEENSIERLLHAWKDWNPSAGFLHFSTRDMPYETDLRTLDWHVRRFARQKKIPEAAKNYPRAMHTPLPVPRTNGEFGRVLLARRTWRRFSREALALTDLGTLLGLTWGVREWTRVPGVGRFAMKTSPSGGALHSIEAYVVARNVKGIPRGLYHYNWDRHRLELLRLGATPRQIQDYLAGQQWFSGAAALVLMTSRFGRAQWKYRNARAYRVVILEAGHLCQTFCLVATWLGLAPFCTMALAESRIEKDLGIDGVTEGVIYAAGVGKIPPGGNSKTAPLPEFSPKRK
jgi:SagB-type dehydrogenase family enzyme